MVKPVLKLHNDDVTPPLSIVTDAGVNVKPVHLGVSVTEPLNGQYLLRQNHLIVYHRNLLILMPMCHTVTLSNSPCGGSSQGF